jgi:regulator of nucleoside diphosphate kinase
MRAAFAPRLVGAPERDPADVYALAWVRMNEGITFAVLEDQLRYLQAIALSMDDEIASLLLLKKLNLADRLTADDPARDLVGMNSYLEFRFGSGNRHFCRLLHPSVCSRSFDLSIASRLGAGVVGLRAGQTLLWPDSRGSPRELHVIDVKNGTLAQPRSRRPTGDEDDLPPAAA